MLVNKLKDYNIILGSVSPRRRELFSALGFPFDVADPDIDENCPDTVPPKQTAVYLAEAKAAKLGVGLGSRKILITADTIVLCDNRLLSKPGSREEAVGFLKLLSGREHLVITGVCLRLAERQRSFSVETVVTFRQLDDDEIDYYVDNYSPYDKAGGYGIQEWIGYVAAERIEGSYFNVIGLPVSRLYRELNEFVK
jgi:septum formation protein